MREIILILVLAVSLPLSATQEGSDSEPTAPALRQWVETSDLLELLPPVDSSAGSLEDLGAEDRADCDLLLRCLFEARAGLQEGAAEVGSTTSADDLTADDEIRLCIALRKALAADYASVSADEVLVGSGEPCAPITNRLGDGEGIEVSSESLDLLAKDLEKPWKELFAELCGLTTAAPSLSEAELRSLVARCDALLKRLNEIDDPSAKVYVFRLRNCRDFYQYSLEVRAGENSPGRG